MRMNRSTGPCSVTLVFLLFVFASCDTAENTSPGVGGAAGTGGHRGTDTSTAATGGANTGTGGANAASGGAGGAGGATGTGGAGMDGGCATPTANKDANCALPAVVSGSFTASGNYFTIGDYSGYGFVYISPTPDPTNSVTCANSSFGSGTLTALCGAGTVPADCTNNAVGGVGFNLAQPKSGGDPAPAIAMTVQQVVVTFTNTANSDLHIQIVQYDGSNQTNYCYAAKDKASPLTIGASEFTTTCYLPDDPGSPWDGTGAESFQFIVPSRTPEDGDTPFDLCIQNLEFS